MCREVFCGIPRINILQTIKKNATNSMYYSLQMRCESVAKGYMQEMRERIWAADEGSVFSTSDSGDIADINAVRSAFPAPSNTLYISFKYRPYI